MVYAHSVKLKLIDGAILFDEADRPSLICNIASDMEFLFTYHFNQDFNDAP
jgi:hypothetical protein